MICLIWTQHHFLNIRVLDDNEVKDLQAHDLFYFLKLFCTEYIFFGILSIALIWRWREVAFLKQWPQSFDVSYLRLANNALSY